jgi:glyoxylase-like metal-dependent hydrolase (beta-lactamase superfamily II)
MQQQKAKVKILLKGYFKWVGQNKCKASCTVSLIQDGKLNILVDTGTRSNQEKLIKALKKEGLNPADINYVIITHPHTDHLENLGLFDKAQSMNVFEMKKDDVFKLTEEILEKGEKRFSKNVKIISTPGHTAECISVLVETDKGVVAIAGDLFVRKQVEKAIFLDDEKVYQRSRKKIIKLADYIIPGHAGIFKVKK